MNLKSTFQVSDIGLEFYVAHNMFTWQERDNLGLPGNRTSRQQCLEVLDFRDQETILLEIVTFFMPQTVLPCGSSWPETFGHVRRLLEWCLYFEHKVQSHCKTCLSSIHS